MLKIHFNNTLSFFFAFCLEFFLPSKCFRKYFCIISGTLKKIHQFWSRRSLSSLKHTQLKLKGVWRRLVLVSMYTILYNRKVVKIASITVKKIPKYTIWQSVGKLRRVMEFVASFVDSTAELTVSWQLVDWKLPLSLSFFVLVLIRSGDNAGNDCFGEFCDPCGLWFLISFKENKFFGNMYFSFRR